MDIDTVAKAASTWQVLIPLGVGVLTSLLYQLLKSDTLTKKQAYLLSVAVMFAAGVVTGALEAIVGVDATEAMLSPLITLASGQLTYANARGLGVNDKIEAIKEGT